MSNQHGYDRDVAADGSDFQAVECDVIATGAVMQAMWSLLAELAGTLTFHPRGHEHPGLSAVSPDMGTDGVHPELQAGRAMLGVGLASSSSPCVAAYLTNRLVPCRVSARWTTRRLPAVLPPIPDGLQDGEGDLVYMLGAARRSWLRWMADLGNEWVSHEEQCALPQDGSATRCHGAEAGCRSGEPGEDCARIVRH
jgi:hypothetical protein